VKRFAADVRGYSWQSLELRKALDTARATVRISARIGGENPSVLFSGGAGDRVLIRDETLRLFQDEP
jgi:hypothetical protein